MNPCPNRDRPDAAYRGEFCHRCGRDTTTVLLPLKGGLIGRCCAACRACRKGRPFATRKEFERFQHDAASMVAEVSKNANTVR